MQPSTDTQHSDQQQALAEIDIRGRFLKMAVDLEGTLLAIMSLTTPAPDDDPALFKLMTMGHKIDTFIERLKSHNIALYQQYQQQIESLWEFRAVRNDFAHNKIRFDNPVDLSSFKVFFVDVLDGKAQLLYKQYTMDFANEKIVQFTELNELLVGLNQQLYDSFVAAQQAPGK